MVNGSAEATKVYGLTISLKKILIMYQLPQWMKYRPLQINIAGNTLNVVKHYYCSGVVPKDKTIKNLVNYLSKVTRVWHNYSFPLSINIEELYYHYPAVQSRIPYSV